MHLDGAQTFGALDVNLTEIGCDSYSASAHKWLMGPLEAGILWVRAERIPQIWPSIVTAGWTDHLKGARKFEVFGQRDDPRVVALEAAVDFINLIGMPAVEARVQALATRAKVQLREMAAVELKTNLEPELSGGVVKFRLKNVPTKQAYDTLWEKHRLAIAMTPVGRCRGLAFFAADLQLAWRKWTARWQPSRKSHPDCAVPSKALQLKDVIQRLEAKYGRPQPPVSTDPFELILWESVAYLATDIERARAFSALRERVGTKPGCISAAQVKNCWRLPGRAGASRLNALKNFAAPTTSH